MHLHGATRLREKPGGLGKLAHRAVDRPWGRDESERQVQLDRLRVDLERQASVKGEGAELGGEQHPPAEIRVIERLLAEPVPRQQEPPAARVPEREGEHAVQPLQGLGPPGEKRVQNHLGVGARAE